VTDGGQPFRSFFENQALERSASILKGCACAIKATRAVVLNPLLQCTCRARLALRAEHHADEAGDVRGTT